MTGGYHDNPEANAEAFTEDGWFDTGDLAYLRDGELYITGRAKDVIIVNGVNHYSHEIEACVEELPFVERSFTAAVAVRSDPSSPTDELALFLHLTEEATAEALREIAGKVTREIGVSPAFMVPVGRDAIPKTEIGKIQRTRLRKSFEAGTFDEEIRRTQLLLGSAATVPDWFLRPVWQRAERPEVRTTPPGRHTLVSPAPTPGCGVSRNGSPTSCGPAGACARSSTRGRRTPGSTPRTTGYGPPRKPTTPSCCGGWRRTGGRSTPSCTSTGCATAVIRRRRRRTRPMRGNCSPSPAPSPPGRAGDARSTSCT